MVKTFKEKKIIYLTLANQELNQIIRKLLIIYPVESWPNDNNHNLIKLSLTDLRLLTPPPSIITFEHSCSRCGIEVSKTQATGRVARCKSCYATWKREQRARLKRD